MIVFRDVRKVYDQGRRAVAALDGLSLEISHGEFVAVMGPSGSGKSTLLHLAGGLDLPSHGDVLIEGRLTRELDDDALSRLRLRQVGFVFQFFNLMPTLTVLENTALPLLLAGERWPRVKPRAEALLARVGLADRAGHLPEELSGGQMQRVALARALVGDPPLILADEPTGNLDSATGGEVLELLRDLAEGKTIVMVTHDARAATVAKRVIRLHDGRVA